jgi:hypothetical protein
MKMVLTHNIDKAMQEALWIWERLFDVRHQSYDDMDRGKSYGPRQLTELVEYVEGLLDPLPEMIRLASSIGFAETTCVSRYRAMGIATTARPARNSGCLYDVRTRKFCKLPWFLESQAYICGDTGDG